jgi:positive regulator of sigma E activity
MHPPRPELTLHEKQAYEGAKLFYTCFLPLVIAILIICTFIMVPSIITIIVYNFLLIGSYWVAYRYYGLCNSIDVRLVRQR